MSDQTMQILGMLGTWVGGLGAFAAAGVALGLARRAEKVKLKCSVGLRLIIGAGLSEEGLSFNVTNIGERSVTIESIGWCIGRGKNKKHAIQSLTNLSTDQYPKKIDHGERASFIVYFSQAPDWLQVLSGEFIKGHSINSLRAQIHTSVGHTENVKPEENLLTTLNDASSSETGEEDPARRTWWQRLAWRGLFGGRGKAVGDMLEADKR